MLLNDILTVASRWSPTTTALVDTSTRPARRWTFVELADDVDRLRRHIAASTSPGARVAIDASARAEVVIACYAVPAANRVAVLVNTRLSAAERADAARRLQPELTLDDAAFDQLGERRNASSAPRDERTVDAGRPPNPDAVAWLIDTSGTTGSPKSVMLTHRSLLAAATNTLVGRPVAADDTYLFPFPLYHVATYNVMVHHLARRPVVLVPRFDPHHLVATIDTEKVTSMSLAPTMLAMLLESAAIDHVSAARGGTLRRIGYGASGIDPDMLGRAMSRLGCDFAQGYGMTELSGNATFLTPADHRAGRVLDAGRPGPLADVTLGEDNEILVAGPQLCAGYYGRPDASAELLRPDDSGRIWLHTGDVGELHNTADGPMLRVVDRLKDIIVTGGENVASREVENALARHPGVRGVAVIGSPHPRWGEQITAVVVGGSTPPTAAELEKHCRTLLAGYKVPKRWEFADELPTNASGKVLKTVLRDRIGR